MEPPRTAVYDANILYPAPVRDLFIRLAQAGLVRAKWTEAIHDEWMTGENRDILNSFPAVGTFFDPDQDCQRSRRHGIPWAFSCALMAHPARPTGPPNPSATRATRNPG